MERRMMDAASGGAIVNKTPQAARELISTMAANAQQFGFRQETNSRKVNEVNISGIEQQISDLTSDGNRRDSTSQDVWHMHCTKSPNRHVPYTAGRWE